MNRSAARSIDDFLNPDYRLIANHYWLKQWQKLFGVLAVLTSALLVYFIDKDLPEGGLGLPNRVKFEFIITAGTALMGMLVGLLLRFIPIKQLRYSKKLRLAFFAGIFICSAAMLFALLADL